MKSFLFLVTTDPRSSGRAAEALRMAAGVSVWKKAEVRIYLRDTAVLFLKEDAEGRMDGENCGRYLSILRESGGPIYVQEGFRRRQAMAEEWPVEEISDTELAALASAQDHVLRF